MAISKHLFIDRPLFLSLLLQIKSRTQSRKDPAFTNKHLSFIQKRYRNVIDIRAGGAGDDESSGGF